MDRRIDGVFKKNFREGLKLKIRTDIVVMMIVVIWVIKIWNMLFKNFRIKVIERFWNVVIKIRVIENVLCL